MEIYDSIRKFIDSNIYSCLIPLLLAVIVIEIFFKNRFKTRQVVNLVRGFLILYFAVGLVYNLIGILFFPDKFAFVQRATGPYGWAFWIMFLAATVFPLTLFYKKLALNPFYLIVVVFLMKIGMYFERFVIIVTSYHRDYSPFNSNFDSVAFWLLVILLNILEGFIIAAVLLGVFEVMERRKTKQSI